MCQAVWTSFLLETLWADVGFVLTLANHGLASWQQALCLAVLSAHARRPGVSEVRVGGRRGLGLRHA